MPVSKKRPVVKKKSAKAPAKKSANPFMEKKTGEKYKSKSAMMKHERGESAAMRKKEYGKSFKKGMK